MCLWVILVLLVSGQKIVEIWQFSRIWKTLTLVFSHNSRYGIFKEPSHFPIIIILKKNWKHKMEVPTKFVGHHSNTKIKWSVFCLSIHNAKYGKQVLIHEQYQKTFVDVQNILDHMESNEKKNQHNKFLWFGPG
jgi:hypothetical protein